MTERTKVRGGEEVLPCVRLTAKRNDEKTPVPGPYSPVPILRATIANALIDATAKVPFWNEAEGKATMAIAQTWNTAELKAKDKAHLLHPLSNLKQLRETGPLVFTRGEGVYLWDSDGKRYMDTFSGLWNVNVGHGRHELAVAAADQIDEVAFVPTFFGLASPPAIELGVKLAELFPGSLNHVQFTSGGSESNETALKIARYYWWLKGQPEKIKVISRKMAYHGIAMGALAATGIPTYHEGFGPGVPGFVHIHAPYQYRTGDGLSEAEFVQKLVEDLEATIEKEGAGTIAAMIGEPLQGAGGVVVPPAGYWDAIIPVLKKHNILLIADEVICGFGRTGKMFGMETYGFEPDMAAFAKGVTSGYIPLGGVAVSDEIFDVLSEPDRLFMHGFTYAGHPVACAVALRNIQIIEDERLPENAGVVGEYLLSELHRKLDEAPYIGNIRGKGMMLFVEAVADKATKAKLDPSVGFAAKMTSGSRKRGVMIRAAADGIAIAPPLILTREQADELVGAIVESFQETLG
jgi:adenosylmethionine-8-amino-7-oxononanoate aminotransferase